MANGMSRRQFVERSARLAVLAGLSGSILSACGSDGDSGGSGGGDTIPLARLDNPVTLPDNGSEPVASGQEPERHPAGPQLRRLHQSRDPGGLRAGDGHEDRDHGL